MIKPLSRFLYIIADKKKNLLLLLCLVLLTSVLDTLGIGLVGPFVALAVSPDFIHKSSWLHWAYMQSKLQSTNQFILLTGLLLLCIFCFKSFLSFNIHHYIHKFAFKQEGHLRSRLLHSYLSVPYTFHLHTNSAVLIHNIIGETQKFCIQVLLPGLQLVANLTIVCLILSLLFITNLEATMAILSVMLFIFFIYYLAKDKIALWGKEKSLAQQEMIRIINHGLGGLKETWIIGCEEYFENQMHQQSKRFATAASAFSIFKFLPRVIIEPLMIVFLVTLIILSLFNQQGSQNLLSSLGIFTTASIRLMPVISQILTEFSLIRNSSYSLNQLYLSLKELEQQDMRKPLKPGNSLSRGGTLGAKNYENQAISFTREIVLEDVAYRYPETSKAALNSISLSIKKGQSIALIGKSGAGKTTLVDVILGLLTPENGDIKVDNTSIYENLRSWQSLIGYIPQSIFLTDDSIMRNIAFGVPDELIDLERLNKAIEAAHITELVEQLPNNIQTLIGERGVRLSGGQRQRIGIARALYHEREILVLDEATAALDSETESRVTESIKSLSGLKTMIVIAHRLATVQHCDCIYLIDKGRVVKSGSYREVVLEEHALNA